MTRTTIGNSVLRHVAMSTPRCPATSSQCRYGVVDAADTAADGRPPPGPPGPPPAADEEAVASVRAPCSAKPPTTSVAAPPRRRPKHLPSAYEANRRPVGAEKWREAPTRPRSSDGTGIASQSASGPPPDSATSGWRYRTPEPVSASSVSVPSAPVGAKATSLIASSSTW